MYVTTSGSYLPAALVCTRETLGIGRMLLGTDHPFESLSECMGFLESQALNADDRLRLYQENAAARGFLPGSLSSVPRPSQ